MSSADQLHRGLTVELTAIAILDILPQHLDTSTPSSIALLITPERT
jgi:hypothetical protein